MGLVEEGKTPADSAACEVLDETEWRPGPIKTLIYAEPANGITDSQYHILRADGRRTRARRPRRTSRTGSNGPVANIRDMIDRSGSLVGLLYVLMDESTR